MVNARNSIRGENHDTRRITDGEDVNNPQEQVAYQQISTRIVVTHPRLSKYTNPFLHISESKVVNRAASTATAENEAGHHAALAQALN
ncbi:MAG: hypothetical protein ACRCZA_00055 [Shewanella sp.]|uniref:hypothetical protein n=1 Tax=Shewanella sp. TaxID=50422 RepID=UPI003F386738